jgi:hypothetical protein
VLVRPAKHGTRLSGEPFGLPSPRPSCPGGGIGRRGRLKTGRPHGRVGSSPTPGIASIASSAIHASRACTASGAAPLLPNQAMRRVRGGKAGYKTATDEVGRGWPDRARRSARGSFLSESRVSGVRPAGKKGRAVEVSLLTSVVEAVVNCVKHRLACDRASFAAKVPAETPKSPSHDHDVAMSRLRCSAHSARAGPLVSGRAHCW